MRSSKQTFGIMILLCSILSFGFVHGQKRGQGTNRTMKTERTTRNYDRVHDNHKRHNDRYRTQPIRRNPHYRYPTHRRVVRTLPRHHVRIVYRGMPYFYYSGIYYTMYGDEYIVVLPPRGFRISVLPVGHVRIVIGPRVYFYHSGVYYVECQSSSNSEQDENYEVTQPPVGVEVSELPEDSKKVTIDGQELFEYNDVFYKEVLKHLNHCL